MPPHAQIELAFPAEPESAPQFRSALRAFLEDALVEREKINDVVLAAGEAAGNAIEHAYRGRTGIFRLKAVLAPDRLVVEVWDMGRWRLDGDPERGRGLGIMRALVDDVAIESTRAGTSVKLVLALAAEPPSGER
jgi:anti-sigma regulatory factor (Ser/Thr protein kinase)